MSEKEKTQFALELGTFIKLEWHKPRLPSFATPRRALKLTMQIQGQKTKSHLYIAFPNYVPERDPSFDAHLEDYVQRTCTALGVTPTTLDVKKVTKKLEGTAWKLVGKWKTYSRPDAGLDDMRFFELQALERA